ncbi:carbohydrate ABC transporter permease [Roseomonas sp. BN140053]|uniref:carbohydrate ABC transporter permease n=1 Tax=Roseomonas sp. BN140053 TaxID=3391898 RepID=UPI0039E8D3E6
MTPPGVPAGTGEAWPGAVASRPATGTVGLPRRRRRRNFGPRFAPYLFLAPALVPGVLFYLLPVGVSLILSFTDWNLLSAPRWVGWRNYTYLLSIDPTFYRTLLNTFVFAIGGAVVGIPLALLVAWAISLSRGKAYWRVIFWLPMVTNVVAVAYAWRFVLDPSYGLLNRLLELVGLGGPEWLGSPTTAMISVVAVSVWMGLGHNILLFAAGLESIDESLYEAARLDGAGPWRILRHVTLPLLRPTLLFASVTGLISGLGTFALILLLTAGGPEGSTNVSALYIYQMAFEHLRMGRASAAALILFVLVLLLTLLQVRVLRRGGLDAH